MKIQVKSNESNEDYIMITQSTPEAIYKDIIREFIAEKNKD